MQTLSPPRRGMIREEFEEANPVLKTRPAKYGLLPDPSEVPAMFENLGLRPVRQSYREVDDGGNLIGCCALTAVYCTRVPSGHQQVIRDNLFIGDMASKLGVPELFRAYATTGFDGKRAPLYDVDARKAYAWGADCWQACLDAGLCGDPADVTLNPATGPDLADLGKDA